MFLILIVLKTLFAKSFFKLYLIDTKYFDDEKYIYVIEMEITLFNIKSQS